MLKNIVCGTVLLASIDVAHADWNFSFTKNPMTDEKRALMLYMLPKTPSIVLRYFCWGNKSKSRIFEVWPGPGLQSLIDGENTQRIK